MRSAGAVIKRTLVSFYDDQMTHHAAALTYYSLMSLFPATLLGLSLLGLLGQYPSTYNAIINYLRDVVPHSALVPLDSSLRQALQHKGTAVTAFVTSIALTLYGTTGVLEAARRALNVVFELDGGGRSFLRRKSIDIVFTFVLMGLVLASLIMIFVGGRFASDLFGFIGLGPTAASVWSVARWPGALAITTLIFALIYYVTPDVEQRAFRWVTPGAFVGSAHLARRLGRLLGLHLAGGQRGRPLRGFRRRDRAGGVALAHQRGPSVRGRARCGDRASQGARRGRPRERDAQPADEGEIDERHRG